MIEFAGHCLTFTQVLAHIVQQSSPGGRVVPTTHGNILISARELNPAELAHLGISGAPRLGVHIEGPWRLANGEPCQFVMEVVAGAGFTEHQYDAATMYLESSKCCVQMSDAECAAIQQVIVSALELVG
ncbi:MAG: hypothetical protein HY696_01730 [Deltaproteobacteria bacterium]|nr:hypothetical protein [Deltaproteobacteria bacterium]